MTPIYQKFFVKRYIEETVLKHEQMKYWSREKIINIEKVIKAENLHDFHNEVTAKILKYQKGSKQVFENMSVKK